MWIRLAAATLACAMAGSVAQAATLDRVKESGIFRIGYREDTAPFSSRNDIGEAAGYVIDICRQVAADIKDLLGLPGISIEHVLVTAENRFDAIKDGSVDLLCEATTVTLSRRAMVDFSLPTFVDGASVLYRADGPRTFEHLVAKPVGVRRGTTTEEILRQALSRAKVDAVVTAVGSHEEGLRMLEAGEITAYFADKTILQGLYVRSKMRSQLALSERYFSFEPYALALAHGDDEFRLAVDRTLSRLCRSGGMQRIFQATFGKAQPSQLLQALFSINGLPE